jgi:hypothetical protein
MAGERDPADGAAAARLHRRGQHEVGAVRRQAVREQVQRAAAKQGRSDMIFGSSRFYVRR